MPTLFRVFPWLTGAKIAEPGGALHTPPQGGGRIDNPGLYAVLYLGGDPAGAIAEAFGRFPEWTSAVFEGSPSLPGSVRALAQFRFPDDVPVCNLDDPAQLLALGLRPSDIVSRDYAVTRTWARRIHDRRRWKGLSWWSYYNPEWFSFGLWDIAGLRLEAVRPLSPEDPDVVEASKKIVRRIVQRRN